MHKDKFVDFAVLQKDFQRAKPMGYEEFKHWLFMHLPMNRKEKERYENPLQAIREKCLHCCSLTEEAIATCNCTNCPLWSFRYGKNPFAKNEKISEQQLMNLVNESALHEEIMKNEKDIWAN